MSETNATKPIAAPVWARPVGGNALSSDDLLTKKPELLGLLLRERHVNHLELEAVRPEEVARVVSAWAERELARDAEDFGAEFENHSMCFVNLLVTLDIEGNVVKPRLVYFEGMVSQVGLGLPDVECGAVRGVEVHRQVVIGSWIANDVTHGVAEELEKRC